MSGWIQLGICQSVIEERERQDHNVVCGKFPWNCADPEAPTAYKLAVLMEEVGEVANGCLADMKDLGANRNLEEELVQVAAVAVAWLESIRAKA